MAEQSGKTAKLFIVFLVCEVAYVAAVRLLVHNFTGSLAIREIYWSVLRLASLGALWVLFKRSKLGPATRAAGNSLAWLPALGLLVIPVFVGNASLPDSARGTFAVTSLIVGLREEVAYRGIFQNWVSSRAGLWAGLLISNLAFVCYHIGVQPFTISYTLQAFLVGLALGLAYELTASILIVSLLHAAFDAIWVYTPLLMRPWPEYIGTIIAGLVLIGLIIFKRTHAAMQPSAGRN